MEGRLSSYTDTSNIVSTVTSLPGSPVDGQIIAFKADATNGVQWLLRYNSASASAYKWEFIGGSPLVTSVATKNQVTSSSYSDLGAVGPSVVLPTGIGGDFSVTIGADFDVILADGAGGGFQILMSATFGAVAANDSWSIDFYHENDSTGETQAANAFTFIKTGVTSAATITTKYKKGSSWGVSPAGWVLNRWIEVRPIRVG